MTTGLDSQSWIAEVADPKSGIAGLQRRGCIRTETKKDMLKQLLVRDSV